MASIAARTAGTSPSDGRRRGSLLTVYSSSTSVSHFSPCALGSALSHCHCPPPLAARDCPLASGPAEGWRPGNVVLLVCVFFGIFTLGRDILIGDNRQTNTHTRLCSCYRYYRTHTALSLTPTHHSTTCPTHARSLRLGALQLPPPNSGYIRSLSHRGRAPSQAEPHKGVRREEEDVHRHEPVL